MIEVERSKIKKVDRLKISLGIAYRAFKATYATVGAINTTAGDTLSVNYKITIK